MQAALRPYATAGVALVGAALISVTPMTGGLPDLPVAHLETRLLAAATASSSILNVPVNAAIDIANIPYYESLALDEYAYALGPAGQPGGVPGWIPPGATLGNGGAVVNPADPATELYALGGTGSWYMESMGNTWGWDNGNWPQLAAISQALLPFAFTEPIAAQLQGIAQAEIIDGSQTANCEFECANPLGYIGGWFQTPLTALLSPTYKFPNTQTDTVGSNSSTGVVNVGPNGNGMVAIWANQPWTLNPLAPLTAITGNLTGSPASNPIMLPNPANVLASGTQLFTDFTTDFNPFVTGSFLYWGAPTLYSIPAAIGGTIQDFTGIPNQFINIGAWQPNGAEPLSGYNDGPASLLTGLPEGFEYLAEGLLGYLNPGTYLTGLGLPTLSIPGLGLLGLPNSLPGAVSGSTTPFSSLLSGMNPASVLALGNILTGTGTSGSAATGLSSLISDLGGGSLSSLLTGLLGKTPAAPAVSTNTTNTLLSNVQQNSVVTPTPKTQFTAAQGLHVGTQTTAGDPGAVVDHVLNTPGTSNNKSVDKSDKKVDNASAGTSDNTIDPSSNVMTKGNFVSPGSSFGGSSSGGSSTGGKSFGDRINNAVSNALGGVSGGGTKTLPGHQHG